MANPGNDFSELMRRIGEGSDDAAWELVTQYGDNIHRAVRRVLNVRLRSKYDSLDFVQLVWKSFFRVREKSDRFQSPEELAAFLVTMARNKVGMETRRRLMTEKYNVRQEQPIEQVSEESIASRQPAPIDIAIAREQWDRMLQDQPEYCQQIIHLRLQGHTCEDIGRAVHVSERTVRRFLQKLLHTTSV